MLRKGELKRLISFVHPVPMLSGDQPDSLHIGRTKAFWGEMAPCEHAVQIYSSRSAFLDYLEAFVTTGLEADEAVVVIATPTHLEALVARLHGSAFDMDEAQKADRFMALDAEETLRKFMVERWPDEGLFEQTVGSILAKARGPGRRVRAFGEMVALLWGQGLNGATVRLEFLWHQFCKKENFPLFCAYPRCGFTQDAEESIREICAAHSLVVAE